MSGEGGAPPPGSAWCAAEPDKPPGYWSLQTELQGCLQTLTLSQARTAANRSELILSHHGGGSVLPSVQSLVTGGPEDCRLFPAAGPLGDLCEGRGDKRAFLKLHPENCFQSGVWQMPASLQQAQLYPASEPRFCLLSGHLKSIIKSHSFHTANHKTATPILGWLPKHQPSNYFMGFRDKSVCLRLIAFCFPKLNCSQSLFCF